MSKSKNELEMINHPPLISELHDYTIEVEIPVYWREMDAFGHVNNTVYFKYFEDARLAYFWELGYNDPSTYRNSPTVFMDSGIGPILGSTSCKFKSPLDFPDKIHVGTRVTDIRDKKIEMDYLLISEENSVEAAEGEATVITYDYSKNESVQVPKEVRDRIEEMEGCSF